MFKEVPRKKRNAKSMMDSGKRKKVSTVEGIDYCITLK